MTCYENNAWAFIWGLVAGVMLMIGGFVASISSTKDGAK